MFFVCLLVMLVKVEKCLSRDTYHMCNTISIFLDDCGFCHNIKCPLQRKLARGYFVFVSPYHFFSRTSPVEVCAAPYASSCNLNKS